MQLLEFVKEAEDLGMKFALGDFTPLGKLDLFGYGRRLQILLSKFDLFIEKIIKEHENSRTNQRKDIMDILLEDYNDKTAQIKISRTAIKSFFQVHFIFYMFVFYLSYLLLYVFLYIYYL